MNRKFLVIAVAIVAFAASVMFLVPEVVGWWQTRNALQPLSDREMSQVMAERNGEAVAAVTAVSMMPLNRPVRLAIGNLSMPDAESERRLSDLVLVQLSGTAGLDMVERQGLERAMREADLSIAGLVRAKDAVHVGKLLRADWFLLSSSVRLNETNFLVARIVDARTGVLREAGFFVRHQNEAQQAAELAEFVKQSRQHAARAEIPVYLSVGGFGNLGVNSRQADFPEQLRAYLLAAYRASKVTILEREFAETLLKEVWLDLAGLTEESASNGSAMQSAYWIADGGYQSYEANGLEVELQLDIQRMFGRGQRIVLRTNRVNRCSKR